MDIPLAVVLANSLLIIVGWTRSCPRVYIVGQIFSGVGGSLYFVGLEKLIHLVDNANKESTEKNSHAPH